MEARGLFETVADGKAKAFTVRTLCPDLAHIRLVERPQRVEDVLRLRALIVARTEGVDDVPVEEPRELVKADDAGLLARVCEQIARARLRPAGHDRDGGLRRIVAVLHAGFSPSFIFCVTALSTVTSPSASRRLSSGSPPGRNSCGGVTVRSMIVDSTPT